MSLTDIDFSPSSQRLPEHVAFYLEQMEPHIAEFHSKTPGGFRGFIPSDYVAFYAALSHVLDERLACGNLFCEWGSGLGVATCLASMLGFESQGIEIDEQLFLAAQRFATEFDLPAQFVLGSFLPRGVDDLVDDAYAENEGLISLFAHADDAYAQLGNELRDFDVVFAFPWPNDEELTAHVFERLASDGALLLTYDEATYRLRRK